MIGPPQFHAGPDLEEISWPNWVADEDFRRLKPGAVIPIKVAKNPHHAYYSQGIFVAVNDDGSAQILVDRRSVSEAIYNSQEG